MRIRVSTFLIVPMAFFALLATGCSTAPTMRSSDAIVADIEAVEFPRFDGARRGDAEYVAEYREAERVATEQWSELVRELMDADPGHDSLAQHLPRRWNRMIWEGEEGIVNLMQETEEILAADVPEELTITAHYFQAQAGVREAIPTRDHARALAAADRFVKAAPQDERGARLLGSVADMHEAGSAGQIALYERIIREYEGTRTGRWTAGKLLQATSIGEPFELAFTCAVTNSEVDMQMLRGKVVLIDFWATWCGPCVAKMPELKRVYDDLKDEGFEVIGVSLDQPKEQGGLDRLLAFVEENELTWPQYYQGNGWDSEFSSKWGINGIPTLFLVDREGKLRSVRARANMEEQIKELLAEGTGTAAALR